MSTYLQYTMPPSTGSGSQSSKSGLGGVLKSLTRSLRPALAVPVVINAKVVGGGTEMPRLLQQLQHGPVAARAQAATSIARALEQYSISLIPEIWYLARDLCERTNPSNVRRLALALLKQCIQCHDGALASRLAYFSDIARYCQTSGVDPDFDMFLQAVVLLTKNGRDIHDLYIYDSSNNLGNFVYDALCVADERSLGDLALFVASCLRYNFTLLDTSWVAAVLDRVVRTIHTRPESLWDSLLEPIRSVALFGCVPSECTVPTVRVLCVTGAVEELKEKLWEIVRAMYDDAVAAMCDVLAERSFEDAKVTDTGLQMLGRLFLFMAQEKPLDVEAAWSTVVQTLSHKPHLNTALLRMISHLCAQPDFTLLFPFSVWYSRTSVFALLATLDVASDEDKSSWLSLCESLFARHLAQELVAPKEQLVDLFTAHAAHTSLEIATFVIDLYREEKRCSLLDPNWAASCRKLLGCYFHTQMPLEQRIRALQTIENGYKVSKTVFGDLLDLKIYFDILQSAFAETDLVVLDYMFHEFAYAFLMEHPAEFSQLLKRNLKDTGLPNLSSFSRPEPVSDLFLRPLAQIISKALIVAAAKDAPKAILIYDFAIELLHHVLRRAALDSTALEAALVLMRCMLRLRLTAEGYLFFSDPKEMQGLAAAFKRTGGGQGLWTFPEESPFLPSEHFDTPNRALTHEQIDAMRWFDIALTVLESFIHWELYSFVWAHLCAQMANMALFEKQDTLILRAHRIVCDQLNLNLPKQISFPTSPQVTKADVQVACIRTLSSLLGHHIHFSKTEQDQIVHALLFCLASWDKTAVPCIHMLTTCCYELPLSVKKYLSGILTRLQTGVTSSLAIAPILEFLMSLANVPSLTSNFTRDELKRVFAIGFKYIEYACDMRSRVQQHRMRVQQHGVDAEIDQTALTQPPETGSELTEFLLLTSYSIVSRWFLNMPMAERREFSPFITHNLARIGEAHPDLDEQTTAYLDFVARFTYCDMPPSVLPAVSASLDPNVVCSQWAVEGSILGIETNGSTGHSTVRVRRPTGTAVFNVCLAAQAPVYAAHSVASGHELLQLLGQEKARPLSDDVATQRAVGMLDRVPEVTFHKAGVVYIGPGQSLETEILSNTTGSRAYSAFLMGLGRLVRLSLCGAAYVGGLDLSGADGEYAYLWSDHLSQLVFHTTTMMPNSAADMLRLQKKRHIGNNHVNVFFDESGAPFNFNVIRSQFNFINIVITPPQPACDCPRLLPVYKVRIYRRSGVPGVFATTHFKLVSAAQLAVFVRNTVLMSDLLAAVWHDSAHATNWVRRVRQIRALAQRAEPGDKAAGPLGAVHSFMEQLQTTQGVA